MKIVLVIIALVALPSQVSAYNILGVFPHPGKSHFDVFEVLMRDLANRGHQVTVISHFPQKNPLPNYRDISLLGQSPLLLNIIDTTEIHHQPFHEIQDMVSLTEFGTTSCISLGMPQIQALIKSTEKFDVILQEHFNTDCFLGLNHVFKAPHIGLSSCTVMSWLHNRMGSPSNPAYIPVNLLKYSDKMTFFDRVKNTIGMVLFNYIMVPLMIEQPGNSLARKYLGKDLPDLDEIARNTSVMLVNSHYSINRPRPLSPSVVEVSGMHLGQPKKLPEDLERYINESEHGVIYFSMGSVIKGDSFPEHIRSGFLEAFAELPQRVLWKYENDSLPGKPDNVMIRKWMPQFDILNHPNVVAYIAHGGLLGMTEGVYNGVPMITIPMFGDQFSNAATLSQGGGAVILEFHKLNKEFILDAIKTILQPSYQQNAKELARVYRDRPRPPLETAVWWVEYVARNKGGGILHTAVIDMPFYQTILLDVLAFFGFVLIIVTFIVYKFITWISSRYRRIKVKTN